MKLNIHDKEVELKLSLRVYMLYENIKGKSFELETMTDTIIFMYCVALVSSKDYDFKYDELLDMLDENPNLLTQFNYWLIEQFKKDAMLSPEPDEVSKKKVKEPVTVLEL